MLCRGARLLMSFAKQSVSRDVESLPIASSLKASIKSLGIAKLTRIQAETFAIIRSGKSCLATARTGEGKTLSYLIPVLSRLMDEHFLDQSKSQTSCLVIVPTRELCQQVGSALVSLNPSINVLMAYGKPLGSFHMLLKQNPHIIIGTGGRVSRLVQKGQISLKHIRTIVLDEVDALLNHDYRREVNPLLGNLPSGCQLVAFGATMSPELQGILSEFDCFRNIDQVDTIGTSEKLPRIISHSCIKVSESEPVRISVLATILNTRDFDRAIVFAPSVRIANAIAYHPTLIGRAKPLHSDLPQSERDRVLSMFRKGDLVILVSTDLAARGVDIPGIDLVMSFSLPNDSVGYVHRAGRTGRAGKAGGSIALYSPNETDLIRNIERTNKIEFQSTKCPSRSQQREYAIDSIVKEAVRIGTKSKLGSTLSEFLAGLSSQDKARIVAVCLKGLLGRIFDEEIHQRSILSGEVGYAPILLVDPGQSVIASQSDLMRILEESSISPGLVAKSESGFVVDIPAEEVQRIVYDMDADLKVRFGVEVVVVEKLPKLETLNSHRGRKFSRPLPWKKPHS
jgi:superfamily II DNA/RNA helicase